MSVKYISTYTLARLLFAIVLPTQSPLWRRVTTHRVPSWAPAGTSAGTPDGIPSGVFAVVAVMKKAPPPKVKVKVKVRGFYIATLTQLTSTALHSRQTTGKNEEQKVERRCVTAAPGEPYDPTQTHTSSPIPNSTSP